MNENQNEMTSEQLDVLRRNLHNRDRHLCFDEIEGVFTLARQRLQLREADAEADEFAEKLNKYVRKGEHGIFETLDNLTAELEALRKDKERMSWLEHHNFRPEDSIALLSEVR